MRPRARKFVLSDDDDTEERGRVPSDVDTSSQGNSAPTGEAARCRSPYFERKASSLPSPAAKASASVHAAVSPRVSAAPAPASSTPTPAAAPAPTTPVAAASAAPTPPTRTSSTVDELTEPEDEEAASDTGAVDAAAPPSAPTSGGSDHGGAASAAATRAARRLPTSFEAPAEPARPHALAHGASVTKTKTARGLQVIVRQ